MPHADKLLELIHASWAAQAAYVAAELGIADHLCGGPRSSAELAAATQTHEPSLRRLLRALVTVDLCRETGDGSFDLTPTGRLLAAGEPGSLRHWVIWWGGHLWPVWGNLLYSVRTGKSARSLLTGTEGFAHLEQDPRTAETFSRAMAELTSLAARAVVPAYDFSGLTRIADVGGGHGELLATILRQYPHAQGILFEMPHAIDGARRHLAEAGVADRCELVAGDFFESVPAGADAYILKSVIHDWNDERARQILQNVRRAMTAPSARLLLVERIVPERLEDSPEHRSLARTDLSMLVALGARERSEPEFRKLLQSVGLRVSRIVPAGMTISIIEALCIT